MLRVQGIEAGYGGVRALFGVDLRVEEGEIVALIGANGAGKTTLLSLISGLIRPSAGELGFEGRDLVRLAPKRIVDLGLVQVPEGRQVFSSLTVAENLEMGAYSRKGSAGIRKGMESVYRLFPVLGERKGQAGGTLSGGEQQMLAIGRALMAQPRLLLLDEPSLGLAPLVVAEIMKVILRLKETGTTILLVEQNARQALKIADRAYVLETGRVTLSGPADKLAGNPEVRQAFLGRRRD